MSGLKHIAFRDDYKCVALLLHRTPCKIHKEKGAIIDLVCNLCRLRQQSGFIAALKLAHRLSQELNT